MSETRTMLPMCVKCGHPDDTDAKGICQTQIGSRHWAHCLCKCVFPQPALDAGEQWETRGQKVFETTPLMDGKRLVTTKYRMVATATNEEFAARIVSDHSAASSVPKLRQIAEAARDFIWEPENWEAYQDSKESNSAAWPPEFLLLAQVVEQQYGPMPVDDDDEALAIANQRKGKR